MSGDALGLTWRALGLAGARAHLYPRPGGRFAWPAWRLARALCGTGPDRDRTGLAAAELPRCARCARQARRRILEDRRARRT